MSLTGNFDRREKNRQESQPDFEQTAVSGNESFVRAGRVRNLFFVQPDGQQLFLNYSYLISGDYFPSENTIKLIYTTHEVLLRGRNLELLFEKLSMHLVRKVVAIEKRFEKTVDNSEGLILDILIKKI